MKTVIFLIGCALSGKTSFYEQCSDRGNYCYLSSDRFREIISGNEADQSCSAEVFLTIRYNLAYFLKYGNHDIVIDATNRTPVSRRQFVEITKQAGARLVAICLETPLLECLGRNSKRARKVPAAVIKKQFDDTVWPNEAEGFSRVVKIKTNDSSSKIPTSLGEILFPVLPT